MPRRGLTNVQVGHDVLLDPVPEVLAPLGGADKTVLLSMLSARQIRCTTAALTSSASQLTNRTVRRGFHPFLSRWPKPRTISRKETVPEVGSAAPMTHASRWQPIRTTSSLMWPSACVNSTTRLDGGNCVPGIAAYVFQI